MDSVQSLISSRGAASPSKAPPDRSNGMRVSDDGVQAPRHPSADVLRQAAAGGAQAVCIKKTCFRMSYVGHGPGANLLPPFQKQEGMQWGLKAVASS